MVRKRIWQVPCCTDNKNFGASADNSGWVVIHEQWCLAEVKIRNRGANLLVKAMDPWWAWSMELSGKSGLMVSTPEDIRSMQVLKDASSTSYMVPGSNGVVLTGTTKSGKAGVCE